jgi:hypothetical protein
MLAFVVDLLENLSVVMDVLPHFTCRKSFFNILCHLFFASNKYKNRCANLTILPPDGTPWFCPECINPRQTESSTRGRNARSRAAPMQPSLKRIFHHEPTKRRAKKKMKKTSDKSEPLLEKLPISTSDEMNENLSDA